MKKTALIAAMFLAASTATAAFAADKPSIYAGKCASCHGKDGEGSRMAPKVAGGEAKGLKNVIATGTTASGKKHPKFTFSEAEIAEILTKLNAK